MWHFGIDALVDPQVLPRVAGHFAQRSIIPAMMKAQVDGDRLRIEIAVDSMDRHQAECSAAKLREGFTILAVRVYRHERLVAAA
jgi:acetolactate synthase regulatory subunit